MKKMQDWAAVQAMLKTTDNVSFIAETLKMSRTTVYKLKDMKEPPAYKRNDYPCKVDAYAEKIIEWRYSSEFGFNGTRIFRELKKIGYEGSIHPVYDFLNKITEADYSGAKIATIRFETPVGEQAQFDWSPYDMWIGGRLREVFCFTMILAASRKKAILFSLKSDAAAIYEAIQDLFDDLGGVTMELLIDNPKALVIENNPQSEDEIEYNPRALMIAKHLGTELNACNCYWPRTKGKIENPYTYIEEQFVKGNKFTSMEHLNAEAKKFMNEWCDEIHTTTKRVPNLFYLQDEKEALLPLPQSHLYFDDKENQRCIDADCYFHLDTNKYSLPVKYAGTKVFFRVLYGFRIMVYTQDWELIQTMEVIDGREQTKTVEEHFDEIRTAPKSIPQIRRAFTSTFTNGEKYLELSAKVLQQPSHHARSILKLLDMFEAESLDKILAYAIKHQMFSSKEIRNLIKEKGYEIIYGEESPESLKDQKDHEPEGITRSLDYYEQLS